MNLYRDGGSLALMVFDGQDRQRTRTSPRDMQPGLCASYYYDRATDLRSGADGHGKLSLSLVPSWTQRSCLRATAATYCSPLAPNSGRVPEQLCQVRPKELVVDSKRLGLHLD